jgi:hypothetical protein
MYISVYILKEALGGNGGCYPVPAERQWIRKAVQERHQPPFFPTGLWFLENINLYIHKNSPILTLKMEVVYTFEMLATLPTSTWCNHLRTKLISTWHYSDQDNSALCMHEMNLV